MITGARRTCGTGSESAAGVDVQGVLHAGAWKAVGAHRRRCPVVVSIVGGLKGRELACAGMRVRHG